MTSTLRHNCGRGDRGWDLLVKVQFNKSNYDSGGPVVDSPLSPETNLSSVDSFILLLSLSLSLLSLIVWVMTVCNLSMS